MSMISEFVEKLREKSALFSKSDFAVAGIAKDYKESADIIEELSAKLASANMERSERYYNGGWIPCSEKLPEENRTVLTCDKNGWISVKVNVPYKGKKNDFECGYYVAWMPLPEPYKGELP